MLLALIGLAHAVTMDGRSPLDVGFGIALAVSLAYQGARVFPNTRLAPRQVLDARSGDKARSIRLLVSNVFMENHRADDLILRQPTNRGRRRRIRAISRTRTNQLQIFKDRRIVLKELPLSSARFSADVPGAPGTPRRRERLFYVFTQQRSLNLQWNKPHAQEKTSTNSDDTQAREGDGRFTEKTAASKSAAGSKDIKA